MVYRGKPSAACASCRQRRIKCDRKRPGCTQCANIQTQCPGYRNLLDLYFRDETEEVSRRVNKKNQSRSTTSKEGSEEPDLPAEPRRERHGKPLKPTSFDELADNTTAYDQYPGSLTLIPSQDASFMAVTCFINGFLEDSHFDYLPPLYLQSPPSSPLVVATQCVATASLASDWRNSTLMIEARRQYSEAIKLTNAALCSPVDALQDHTLISVLLLALFETVAFEGRHSPDDWNAHTRGAATLIRLRGKKQFKTILGRRLFLQVANNVRIGSTQEKKRVPDDIKMVEQEAWSFMDRSNPAFRLSAVADSFTNFRADLEWRSEQDPLGCIESCLEMDRNAIDLIESFPPDYQHEVLPLDQVPCWAFQGLAHRYPSTRVAHQYNTIRMIRLFAHEWIWYHADMLLRRNSDTSTRGGDTGTSFLEDLQRRAEEVATQMIHEILATVPYFTQLSSTSPPFTSRFLIMPVAAAGETSLSTDGAREYSIKCLRLLGDLSRMRQASKAAEMLEEHKPLEDWLHIWHIS